VEVRSVPGQSRIAKDLPPGGGGDLDAEDKEFAVDAPVTPAGILPGQAQHQLADGTDGPDGRGETWPRGGVPEIPVPAQQRVGWTSGWNRPSMCRGSRCSRAARNARSAGENRGRVLPSCRSRTVIWWRNAKISMSLSRSLTGSSRSNANTLVTLR